MSKRSLNWTESDVAAHQARHGRRRVFEFVREKPEPAPVEEKPRKAKYGAKKVVTEEGVFDSKMEYKRWCDLKLLQSAGKISNLRRQVEYVLEINGQKICKYRADAVYEEHGQEIVEDAKGMKTPAYNLKKRLMKALLGITISEWPARKRKARKKAA